jgi:hypothetical protein
MSGDIYTTSISNSEIGSSFEAAAEAAARQAREKQHKQWQ